MHCPGSNYRWDATGQLALAKSTDDTSRYITRGDAQSRTLVPYLRYVLAERAQWTFFKKQNYFKCDGYVNVCVARCHEYVGKF